MQLTFQNKNFVLHGHVQPTGDLLRFWNKTGLDIYETKNIKAAARFRMAADNKAEKIFKKFMLCALPIPAGRPPTPLGLELFPFQENRGVPFILGQNKTYLGHDPGLGKSAQVLVAINSKPGSRTLIICPSIVMTTWAREIMKWSIGFPSITKVTGLNINWGSEFVICSDAMLINPDILKALSRERFDFTIVDEAHRFKTPDASRTIALFGGKSTKLKSPGLIYKSDHVVFLSGTPMLNRPVELWPVLYAAAPETIDFMSYYDFGFRYGGPTRNEYGAWQFLGSTNEAELKQKIIGPFIQRIQKDEVLPDLPKKIREVIYVDEDKRNAHLVALDVHLLRDLSEAPRPETKVEYAVVRHLNGSAKIDFTAKFVADILANNQAEKILLYAYHRDVIDALNQKLLKFSPGVINGGVADEVRTDIQDRFQTGSLRLIIGNIHSMNLGLTLTAATRVVFCEYDWTPANNEQAEDRANRIGSEWSIFCQYIVFQNSIDETILKSTLIKEKRIAEVIG